MVRNAWRREIHISYFQKCGICTAYSKYMFTSQYDRNMIYAMHCACCAACATTGGPPAINIKLFNTQYAEELTMQKPLYFTMKIFQQYWSRECLNISGCYRKINKSCIIWIINRLSSHIYYSGLYNMHVLQQYRA